MGRRYAGKVIGVAEGDRFEPDFDPTLRLRLTHAPLAGGEAPEAREVDLTPLLAEELDFEAEGHRDGWVWGVQDPLHPHRMSRDRG